MTSRADLIKASAEDLVADFLYHDRKEDGDLPKGSIQAAIAAGEVTSAQILYWFSMALLDGLRG